MNEFSPHANTPEEPTPIDGEAIDLELFDTFEKLANAKEMLAAVQEAIGSLQQQYQAAEIAPEAYHAKYAELEQHHEFFEMTVNRLEAEFAPTRVQKIGRGVMNLFRRHQ